MSFVIIVSYLMCFVVLRKVDLDSIFPIYYMQEFSYALLSDYQSNLAGLLNSFYIHTKVY